jgi:hypothetical protein
MMLLWEPYGKKYGIDGMFSIELKRSKLFGRWRIVKRWMNTGMVYEKISFGGDKTGAIGI